MVLFNDMSKSLADSQLQTLMYVIAAILLMFAMLLGSVVLALVALIPNVIAAVSVTAVMDYAEIPRDLMTSTIAVISIGQAMYFTSTVICFGLSVLFPTSCQLYTSACCMRWLC